MGIIGINTIVVIAMGYAFSHLAQLTPMVGKDPHLSKRVDLWGLSVDAIRQRPLLGYGFVAFWNPDSQPAARIREELDWDVPHAHNGYLEILLGLGLIGLGLYAVLFIILTRRALMFFIEGDERYRRWPLSLLAITFLYQFTEGTILNGNNVNFILFCCLAFSLTWKESVQEVAHVSEAPVLAA
jgi:exopolysaccharide production protein ExoQ